MEGNVASVIARLVDFHPAIHFQWYSWRGWSMAERQACHVLAVVAGSNVGVVGAALIAALARDPDSVDELHVITSGAAGGKLRASLLRAAGGTEPLTEWCRQLGIARGDVLFGSRTIHVLAESADASAGETADEMLDTLRALCTGSNIVDVAASVDSGPLAVLAHAALGLVGRSSDQFYFIDTELESSRMRGVRSTRARDLAPRPAILAPAPFVLSATPLAADVTFQELADSRRVARRRLADPGEMILDAQLRTVRVGTTHVVLPRLQFFWLFVFATLAPAAFPLRGLSGNFQVDAHGRIVLAATAPDRAALETVIGITRRLFTSLFPSATEDFPRMFKRACDVSPGLPSIVAKINARLKRELGLGATPYLIAGGRSAEGYRLTLAPVRIRTQQ